MKTVESYSESTTSVCCITAKHKGFKPDVNNNQGTFVFCCEFGAPGGDFVCPYLVLQIPTWTLYIHLCAKKTRLIPNMSAASLELAPFVLVTKLWAT